MGDITNNIDGIFFLSIGTMFIGLLHFTIRYCYKSKCKSFSCCCFQITRDIENEVKEDLTVQKSSSEEKISL